VKFKLLPFVCGRILLPSPPHNNWKFTQTGFNRIQRKKEKFCKTPLQLEPYRDANNGIIWLLGIDKITQYTPTCVYARACVTFSFHRRTVPPLQLSHTFSCQSHTIPQVYLSVTFSCPSHTIPPLYLSFIFSCHSHTIPQLYLSVSYI